MVFDFSNEEFSGGNAGLKVITENKNMLLGYHGKQKPATRLLRKIITCYYYRLLRKETPLRKAYLHDKALPSLKLPLGTRFLFNSKDLGALALGLHS